jgi:putative DNA primase/helicase
MELEAMLNYRQGLEEAVLGEILSRGGSALDDIAGLLDPGDLDSVRLRPTLAVAQRLHAAGQCAELPMVKLQLEAMGELEAAGGVAFLCRLLDYGRLNGTLRATVQELKELPGAGEDELPDLALDENRTDVGAGKAFVALHGRDVRHIGGKWIFWAGRLWKFDESVEVMRRAKGTAHAMLRAAGEIENKPVREAAAAFAIRSFSAARLESMLKLAASEPGVSLRQDELDPDPWLLGVRNGTVDLRTGELRACRRADLITRAAKTEYQAEASCPTWIAFLSRIFDGNEELARFARRAVGYSLTGLTREQVFFLLHGTGSNGKSTFLEVLRALLGSYAVAADFGTFLRRDHDGVRNDLARLRGSRVVTAIESAGNKRFDEAMVKSLTGGDMVSARFLYQEHFEFQPSFKLWLATNDRPRVADQSHAFWRRVRLVPFTVSIPDHEQDRSLPQKLREELPGILGWALQGCREWQESGLGTVDAVARATDEYRAEEDKVGQFLEECCVLSPHAKVRAGELYAQYRDWSERNSLYALSQRAVAAYLGARPEGLQQHRTGASRWWLGIGLGSGDTQ